MALECGLDLVSPLGYGLVLKSWLEWRLESVSVLEQGIGSTGGRGGGVDYRIK
jgi:hypothetical protein